MSEDQVDAAVVALNRARDAAQAAGYQPEALQSRRRRGSQLGSQNKGFRTDAKKSAQYEMNPRDPRPLGQVFSRLVTERGWREPVAVGSVMSRWKDLVGPQIADHTEVESFENSEVVIRCESTNWAAQLKLMTTNLLQTFEQQLGPGVINSVVIHGPGRRKYRRR